MSRGAQKLLAILRRGPACSYVLARSKLGDVKAAIAELTSAGYEIESRREPSFSTSWPVIHYRLTAEPQLALDLQEAIA